MRGLLRQLGYLLGYGALGVLLALLVVGVLYLRQLPQPGIPLTASLDEEFRAGDADEVKTLVAYRAVEDRVFAQLEEQVYDRIPERRRQALDRFSSGSLADPLARDPNWNRTFVWDAPAPKGGVLLLHGLTDGPYSMRALAELVRDRGYSVVGLRFPGHGTAPSGLVTFEWQDMAAASRLAARDLARRIGPDKPLFIAGYSTGAAIAVEYALARLQGEPLPPLAGLILFSPAIGVSPAARFAVWQGKLAAVPGLEAATWTAVAPEYDPYKYASFSINAADQVYRITQAIRRRIDALDRGSGVAGLPPILAFQSAFDATVSAPKVVTALFARLAGPGHELVVFDLNRNVALEPLFKPEVLTVREQLLAAPAQRFGLTVLTNDAPQTANVTALRRAAGATAVVREPTALAWPAGVFSMSHVAVPFRPDDPLYGASPPQAPRTLYLGRTELLGERGLLAIPVGDMVRLRHNPFWPYVAERVEAFLADPSPRSS
jgi:alpha-beta hydrolase superfamily lysophospholipase